jgi:hypothetical protein
MFRWSVLAVALLATAPTIWAALGDQTVSVTSALIHYLVAVPIVAILLAMVRFASKPSRTNQPKRAPQRQG